MPIVVQKYGGSSVADVGKLERVAEMVVATRATGADVVVVVSAMGKTTDQLLALAREVDEAPPRRELDMLLSTGERIAMALLSIAIQRRGVDAISFTGSQCGILTNDRHSDARIIEVRPVRIEDELARGRVVIVAGYQGMSYKREITTLGRGGSDTTAIALAAALGAARAEIYSDVDGVYSADPRVVADASHLPELTYEEMESIAHAGAKVLHHRAVEYARRHRIAIHARSTFAPQGRETRVADGVSGASRPVVVGKAAVRRVALGAGDLPAVRRELREAGTPVLEAELRDEVVELWVDPSGPEWPPVAAALTRAGVAVGEPGARVTVVGEASLDDALLALSAAGIPVARARTVDDGLVVGVPSEEVDRAVRSLHAALG